MTSEGRSPGAPNISAIPPSHVGRRFMPFQCMQFTLIRPFFHPLRQARFDRVFQHIKPLLVVALPTAQLAVKKVVLPDGFFGRIGPLPRRRCAPELNPCLEGSW